MLFWVILAVSLILIAYWAVAAVRQWIVQRGILDVPNERSSHKQVVPRGGGLVIVALTLGAWLINIVLDGSAQPLWWLAWAGALVVAVTGWLDDMHHLSSTLRLSIHAIAAFMGMVGAGIWESLVFPPLGSVPLGWLSYPLTVLWIVGLINAYNFMDGIDGIAGLQAVIAGGGWFILGLLWEQRLTALLGLTLAGASLGFLFHNWHPARIFMGDVASGFLGYLFAVLPLLSQGDHKQTATLLPGILLVWPFLFDTILTFLRRLKNGENILTAHRSHLYQRLVISGLRHPAVTFLYAVLASLGLIFILIAQWQPAAYLSAICVLSLCCVLLVSFVHKRESTPKNTAQAKNLSGNSIKADKKRVAKARFLKH